MKRWLALLLSAALLCGLAAGCAPQTTEQPPAEDGAVFRLKELPDIGSYTPETELAARWYDTYTDHLIPRDDYGVLIPYVGGVNYYADPGGWTETEGRMRYGLCTADGVIVTDPVYKYVWPFETEDGTAWLQLTYTNQSGSEDEKSYNVLAAADGSFVLDLGPGIQYTAGGGRILAAHWDESSWNSTMTDVYDYNGNLIYITTENLGGPYSDGYVAAHRQSFSDGTMAGGFLDENGEPAFGGASYYDVSDFSNGLAMVWVTMEQCGMIDTGGAMVIPADYSWIVPGAENCGYLCCREAADGALTYDVYDAAGAPVGSIGPLDEDASYGDLYAMDGALTAVLYTEDSTLYYDPATGEQQEARDDLSVTNALVDGVDTRIRIAEDGGEYAVIRVQDNVELARLTEKPDYVEQILGDYVIYSVEAAPGAEYVWALAIQGPDGAAPLKLGPDWFLNGTAGSGYIALRSWEGNTAHCRLYHLNDPDDPGNQTIYS